VDEGEKFFAKELEKLLSLPLETKEDLDSWHRASRELRDRLQQYPDIRYEGETYHFLVDAPIRQRDSGYKRWQEEQVRDYILRVRSECENDPA
jgi:hypothetical protein